MHVVDRRALRRGDVGEHRQIALRPPTARSASSTAEAPSLSGVELAAVIVPSGPPKTGFSFASFSTSESARRFWSRSRPQVGDDQIVEEPALVGRRELAVAGHGQARPGPRGSMPQSRAMIAQCSPIDRPVRGSSLRGIAGTMWPGRTPVRARSLPIVRALAVGLEQRLAQLLVERDRRVRGRVGAAGDARVDLPERDLVGDEHRRLQARAARLLHVVGGRLGGERRVPSTLSRVRSRSRECLSTAPPDDLAEALLLQAEAVDQPVERGRQHVLVGGVRVGAVRAREGNPVAADHGHPAWRVDHLPPPFVRSSQSSSPLGRAPRPTAPPERRPSPGSSVEISSCAASCAESASLASHQRASASAAAEHRHRQRLHLRRARRSAGAPGAAPRIASETSSRIRPR